MKYRLVFVTFCLMCGLLWLYTFHFPSKLTIHSATLEQGSFGKDIYELQGRLRSLGYYDTVVDGDFGICTKNSVMAFQDHNGMKPSGKVSTQVKAKLKQATPNWYFNESNLTQTTAAKEKAKSNLPAANSKGYTQKDLKMMANAVYGEARGESYEGQVAVAAVILNRVKSPEFPNTPTGVIFQPGAFTAVSDGQIWLTPNTNATKAVKDAISGWDPSDGCLYYFNPVTATSKWIWSRPQHKKIGKHIFCH